LLRHDVGNKFIVDESRSDLAEHFYVVRASGLLDAEHPASPLYGKPNLLVKAPVVVNVEHPADPTIRHVKLCVAHQRIRISLSSTRSPAVKNGLSLTLDSQPRQIQVFVLDTNPLVSGSPIFFHPSNSRVLVGARALNLMAVAHHNGDSSHVCFSAGLYGVAFNQFFSATLPISPRFTISPGAVFLPGARRNISQYASTCASKSACGRLIICPFKT
jgi:hypothetical protein